MSYKLCRMSLSTKQLENLRQNRSIQKMFLFFVVIVKMTHVQRTLVVLKPDSVGRSIT